MDLALSDVIGERASPATRPVMAAIYQWFDARAGEDVELEAAVFATVPEGHEASMTPWIISLRRAGFYVFLKPKHRRSVGIESDLLAHVHKRAQQGALDEVIVASPDGGPLERPLQRIAKDVPVTVLGYRERDTFGAINPVFSFLDLEDIDGAFLQPLPRTNLHDLPVGGAWFEPLEFPPPLEGGPAAIQSRQLAPSPQDPSDIGPEAAGGPSLTEGTSQPVEPSPANEASQAVEPPLIDLTAGPLAHPSTHTPAPKADLDIVGEVRRLARATRSLTLAELGDAIREQFPDISLHQLGFESVSDLLSRVTQADDLELVRDAEGRHALVSLWAGAPPAEADPALSTGSAPEGGHPPPAGC